MNANATPTRVFVSYTHDSENHKGRVRALANKLRADGVDATIDQYVHVPPDGWAVWTLSQIRSADFVLVICTDSVRQVENSGVSSPAGLGIRWELRLIFQEIYNAGTVNHRFIPVVFDPADIHHIPLLLTSTNHYLLNQPLSTDDPGYAALYRRLTRQHDDEMPQLGQLLSSNGSTVRPDTSITTRTSPMPVGTASLDLAGFTAKIKHSTGLILAVFCAPWSEPSQAMLRAIERICRSRRCDAQILAVEVQREEMASRQLGIHLLPTLLVYSGGELRERRVGKQTEAALAAVLDRHQLHPGAGSPGAGLSGSS